MLSLISFVLWILINILPEWAALKLLDLVVPGWTKIARRIKNRDRNR